MSLSVQYDFTLDKYRKTLRVHRLHSLLARLWFVVFLWAFPVIAASGFFAWLYFGAADQTDAAGWALVVAGAFSFWFCCALFARSMSVRKVYEATFPSTTKSKQVAMEVGTDGIKISMSGSFFTHFQWNAISKYVEDSHFMLLYVNKSRFIPIPLDQLTAEQIQSLRSYVQANIGAR